MRPLQLMHLSPSQKTHATLVPPLEVIRSDIFLLSPWAVSHLTCGSPVPKVICHSTLCDRGGCSASVDHTSSSCGESSRLPPILEYHPVRQSTVRASLIQVRVVLPVERALVSNCLRPIHLSSCSAVHLQVHERWAFSTVFGNIAVLPTRSPLDATLAWW